jgi:hypothetical protein
MAKPTSTFLLSLILSVGFCSAQIGNYPLLPGICDQGNLFGIGCGIKRTNQSIGSLNFQYTVPIIKFNYCDTGCYNGTNNSCPFYCYATVNGVTYANPLNVLYMEYDNAIECISTFEKESIEEIEQQTTSTSNSGNFISSESSTTVQGSLFVIEQDSYMFQLFKRMEIYNIAIPTFIPGWIALSDEILLAAEMYLRGPYNYTRMVEFVNMFGTDIPINVILGSLIVYTSYFHRCFTETETWDYVTQQSSNFFNNKYSQSGSTSVDAIFQDWSTNYFVAVGGDTTLCTLQGFDTMNDTQIEQYEATVPANPGIVDYETIPIWYPFTDPEISSNLKQVVSDYLIVANITSTNLINDLTPHDPDCVPTWCQIAGAPGGNCTQLPGLNYFPNSIPAWYNNSGYQPAFPSPTSRENPMAKNKLYGACPPPMDENAMRQIHGKR